MKASEITNEIIGREIKFCVDGITNFTMQMCRCETRGTIYAIEKTDDFAIVYIVDKFGDTSIIGANFESGYDSIYDAELI